MDRLKVAKVEHVLYQRGTRCWRGTLHLTQHHLIFVKEDVKTDGAAATSASSGGAGSINKSSDVHEKPEQERIEDDGADSSVTAPASDAETNTSTLGTEVEEKEQTRKEIWIPYAMLWLVTRMAAVMPLDSRDGIPRNRNGRKVYPLAIFTRNFESSAFGFDSDAAIGNVYESIKSCAVIDEAKDLYAFHYEPQPPLRLSPAGWKLYDIKAEFVRQGVGSRTKAWRICDLNTRYELSSTYPSRVCIPSRISDTTVRYAAKYRSKERIPALTYLHHSNLATITRCSQPMLGFNNRSMQDEKLVEAIFTSHTFADPQSAEAQAAAAASEDLVLSGSPAMNRTKAVAVYGAQTRNLIVDARPTTNAVANRMRGYGTENMDHYKGCEKVYLGIENIHIMRKSLDGVADALRSARQPATFGMSAVAMEQAAPGPGRTESHLSVVSAHDPIGLDHRALKRSDWLLHLQTILEGVVTITKNIHIKQSHVLVHCSDGWDRTSQLTALAQLCLDPFYRTMQGFAVLVEKDWVSFGHQFWDRCGHAGSEAYFSAAHDYDHDASDEEAAEGLDTWTNASVGGAGDAAPQAAANSLWDFTKQITANFPGGQSHKGKRGANMHETSPVFHQFLDCVWQIMRQFPRRFEFNERWLLDLFDGIYECKYGTFLFNSEAQRNGVVGGEQTAPASSRTYSIWDLMLDEKRRERYRNPSFLASLDNDLKRQDADIGVLLPNPKNVGFWGALYRWDQDDINSLVRAEAEERKRMLDAAERQRRMLDNDAGSASSGDGRRNAAVSPGKIGVPISSGEQDPVLHPSLPTVTHSELGYKPRVRPNTVGRAVGGTSPMRPQQSNSGTPPLRRQNSIDDVDGAAGAGALDAANKMRNMVLGWGARIQDAYTSATAPQDPLSAHGTNPSTSVPRVVEADYNRRPREASAMPTQHRVENHAGNQNSAEVHRATKSEMPRARNPDAEFYGKSGVYANPWVQETPPMDRPRQSAERRLDGLPNTLVGHDDRQGKPHQDTHPSARQHATTAEPHKKDDSYDPLGVGLG